MRARLEYHHNRACIVWLDSKGAGYPVPDTRRAWRVTIYRRPKLEGER
jgi:hypothetical protein